MKVKFTALFILIPIFAFAFIYFSQKNLKYNEITIKPESYNQTKDIKDVKLLFVGDLMLDRYVKYKILKNNKNFLFPFLNIYNYLNSFDFVIANLEGPISSRGIKVGSIYSFRMDPSIIDSLQKANIKVLNLANNHIFDYGRVAVEDTMLLIKENNLYYYGIGYKESAYEPLILEKYGVRIGFLGFSDFLKHLKPENNKLGIAIVDEKISEYIKEAKKKVDILIVTFHWGEEYQKDHNKRQEEFARKSILAGADLVIGHHPHIIQDIEIFNNKFIFYSLGNFIFDQNFSEETMIGGLVEVEIDSQSKKIKNIYFRKSFLNNNFQVERISEPFLVYNLNEKPLLLKIADEPKEWEQGLMFVKKFDLDCNSSQEFATENNVSLGSSPEATNLDSQFGSLDAPVWPSLTLRLKHSPTAYPNLASRNCEYSAGMNEEKQIDNNVCISSRDGSQEFATNNNNVRISSRDSSQGFATNKNSCNSTYPFDGMIFLFPDKQIRYFWNKNTFVDLEVYWLDDDKIVAKDSLSSIEKTKEIYTIKSPRPVNKVIEVIIK